MRRTMARGTRPVRVAFILGAVGSLIALSGLTPTIAGAVQLAAQDTPTSQTTTCTPNGQGETCAGTFSGDVSPDPFAGGVLSDPNGNPLPPTVTVSQTRNLTNQMVHVTWTNFESSFNPFGAIVPGFTPGRTDSAVAIVECKGDNPQINTSGGLGQRIINGSCYALTPTAQSSDAAGPGNEVLTFTSQDANDDGGTGSADFQVETEEQNTFLGCSATVACSLVVVPNFGGIQQTFGDQQVDCTDHSEDSVFGEDQALDTVQGFPCSWADRIVVPLSFAPTPGNNCPSQDAQFNAEGAPGLEQAMNQWLPGWCKPANKSQTPVFAGYDPTVNEFLARQNFLGSGQALSSSTDVALVTDAASADATKGARPFAYAPVGVSAITIAYYVDNQMDGTPITNLVLDARLVAKLLTESYSQNFGNPNQCVISPPDGTACPENDLCENQTVQSVHCDPNVVGNPVDIFHDPEFVKLNPEYTLANFLTPTSDTGEVSDNFLPTVLAGDSDMTFELTRWIESDPEARAFLEGQPDESGMRVNNAFKGIDYPISQFAPQDSGFSDFPAVDETMQLTWNPVSGLDNVVQRFAGNSSSALSSIHPTCSLPGWTGGPCLVNGQEGVWNFQHEVPENIGSRALFAVVDQGSAASFRLPTAQLLNGAGNAVSPTTTSMSAAVAHMRTNPDKITQFTDDTSTDPKQYPLTTVDYAMVPTCGLTQPKATAITQFLNNVGSSAQLIGTAPGQLPAFGGYLPLNGAQQAQVRKAATDVSTQSCTSPPPDRTVDGLHVANVGPSNSSGNSGPGVSGSSAPGTTAGGPTSATGPSNGTTPAGASVAGNGRPGTPLGLKSLDTGGFMTLVLPVALGVGGLLAVIAGITYALNATEGGRRLLNRMRRRLGMPPHVDETGDVR